MAKAVAVDLDGVLAEYEGWKGLEEIGDPQPGVRGFLQAVREELDLEVVVHTTRGNPDPFHEGEQRATPEELEGLIWRWLQEHRLDGLVDRVWIGTGKPIAVAYVDDRAVLCNPGRARDPEHEFAAAYNHVSMLLGR